MKFFAPLDMWSDSMVIVETRAKKDVRLPATSQIVLVDSPVAIQSSPFPKYLYMHSGGFLVYQLSPFRQVQRLGYGGDVESMAVVGDRMVVLSRDSVVVVGRGESRVLTGRFGGCSVSKIGRNFGVQHRDRLCVYSPETLEIQGEYVCSSHYFLRDVLITSYDHRVSLYRRGDKILEMFMPERIGRVCADPLLTNVYCGGMDGKIFCCNMNLREPTTMAYHKSEVVGLDMSFCGRYLYSADAEGTVCVWDARLNVVIGKTLLESPVKRIHVVYASEWRHGDGAREHEKEMVEIRHGN